MIRALIFDCFGVLYRDNKNMLYDIVPTEKHSELSDIIHASDYGYISRQEYFEKIAELADITPDKISAIDLKQFVRNDPLISQLKVYKKSYKIGLISNIGDQTMDRLFPQVERTELFDAFVLSGEVGITKPSPEIYNIAASRLQIATGQCAMIDDIPVNVDGARRAGMEALLFTNNRQLENDLSVLLKENNA